VTARVVLLTDDVRVVRASELMALLNGQNQKDVAASLGISESTLSRFLKYNDIKKAWVTA
jgi:hypothetical protein